MGLIKPEVFPVGPGTWEGYQGRKDQPQVLSTTEITPQTKRNQQKELSNQEIEAYRKAQAKYELQRVEDMTRWRQ
tara:strand:- start:1148 stop:1372 length:225 start_codon:yes stop_codon:yes gene_type:complete